MKLELGELSHGRKTATVTLEQGERMPMYGTTKGSYIGPGVVRFTSFPDGGVNFEDDGVKQVHRKDTDAHPEGMEAHLFAD